MATYSKATAEYVYQIESKIVANGSTSLIASIPAGTHYELMEWQAYCHDGTASVLLSVLTPATVMGGDTKSSSESPGTWTDNYNLLATAGIAYNSDTTVSVDASAPSESATFTLNGTYGYTGLSDQHQAHWKKELSTGGVTAKEGQTVAITTASFSAFSPTSTEFVQVVTWWKKIVGYEG